jgi:diaminopimelate decarboxylase
MYTSLSKQTLIDLGRKYGLPLFVYDGHVIQKQITALREAFRVPQLEIRYACKAQTTAGILQLIYQAGCGVDTVSPGEIMIALKAGIPPEQITFTPSGVSMDEYRFAISNQVHIHADQMDTLLWLDQHYAGLSVTLRFNPAIQAGGHTKLQVGSDGSKFGFMASQVEELVQLTRRLSLRITGVHMHLGSDIGESESFNMAYEYLLSVGRNWRDTLERVDLGGGFKIPYHPGDHAIDLNAFGKNVTSRFNAYATEIGKPLTMVLEPGKFLVSNAGYLLMEVTGVRQNGNANMAYVSSGFNHFVRPMYYDAYHHFINLTNPDGHHKIYDIVGYLCETDTFASQRSMNEIRTGDILCMMNAGAYGYTMASNYNSRPRPAEVLVDEDGRDHLIRRAETFEDLMRTDTGL